jgi:hypothetical protein
VAGTVPCLGLVDLGHRLVTLDRSQREFAQVLQRYWQDDSRLVVAGDFEDLCGITYYTHHPTQMLDSDPQDLLFGFRKGDARDSFVTTDEFRSEWHSEKRVFVLSDKSFDLPGATVLAESPRDVLRVNHAIPAVATAANDRKIL